MVNYHCFLRHNQNIWFGPFRIILSLLHYYQECKKDTYITIIKKQNKRLHRQKTAHKFFNWFHDWLEITFPPLKRIRTRTFPTYQITNISIYRNLFSIWCMIYLRFVDSSKWADWNVIVETDSENNCWFWRVTTDSYLKDIYNSHSKNTIRKSVSKKNVTKSPCLLVCIYEYMYECMNNIAIKIKVPINYNHTNGKVL